MISVYMITFVPQMYGQNSKNKNSEYQREAFEFCDRIIRLDSVIYSNSRELYRFLLFLWQNGSQAVATCIRVYFHWGIVGLEN